MSYSGATGAARRVFSFVNSGEKNACGLCSEDQKGQSLRHQPIFSFLVDVYLQNFSSFKSSLFNKKDECMQRERNSKELNQ